jgi:hypothetical protein
MKALVLHRRLIGVVALLAYLDSFGTIVVATGRIRALF